MSRYIRPITRVSRRLGVILFPNPGSKSKSFNKKNYKPGMHGQKHFTQLSEFNKQLREKQKARFLYGITERQSKNYFRLASKSSEITGFQFLRLLEQRLDNAVFRAGFASTRPQARQMVNHGLVKLNDKKATIPSIQIRVGDKFEIKEKHKASKLFDEAKKAKYKAPKWLKSDQSSLKCEVTGVPDKDDIEQIIEHHLITEFYSKQL